MRISCFFIIPLFFYGCSVQQEPSLTFVRSGIAVSDTLTKRLDLNYIGQEYIEVSYSFESKLVTHKFPVRKNISLNNSQFLRKKSFLVGNQEYDVFKFIKDDVNIEDDETLYFYSTDFGIILESGPWNSKEELISMNNAKKDIILNTLTSSLKADKDFFTSW